MKKRISDKSSAVDELPLQLPRAETPDEINARAERLKVLLSKAKEINKEHPDLSMNKIMRLLNPLPRAAYTIEEAAQLCGQHYMTIYRLVQQQKIRVVKIGRDKVIPRNELERYLNDTTSQAA